MLPTLTVYLNITSATVAKVFVLSEVESELYTCRSVGSPLPLELGWSAQEMISNTVIQLIDSLDGVQIDTRVEVSGETVSVLRLSFGGNFQSPICRVTNSASNGVLSNTQFTRVDPITGIHGSYGSFWIINITICLASLNITKAIVSFQNERKIYECRAIGVPLPLHISWRAEDDQGRAVELSDDGSDIEIVNSIKNGETISELRLSDDKFDSIVCVVTNGNYPGVVEEEFQLVTGMDCIEVCTWCSYMHDCRILLMLPYP